MDSSGLDAYGLTQAFRARRLSPVEVLEDTLDRIDRLDSELNAFTVVLHQSARDSAREAERRYREPDPPALLGVPITIKDHIWMKDLPATNGSKALRDFRPSEDCGAVQHLKSAGSVIVGKTNNPEFLYRGYTANDLFGVTRNPWNLSRTPGGSSGGSAAAVAAGLGALSLGTDGGGSIRIPACFCGVVGLKPTFGLVPKLPGFRGWPSLSCNGPIARTTRDVAVMMSVLGGLHAADDRSLPAPPVDWINAVTREGDLRDLRVAYTEDMGFAPVDHEVRAAFRSALTALADTDCQLFEDCPATSDPAPTWWRIAAAESYASEGDLLNEHEAEMTSGTASIVRSGERLSARDYLDAQDARSRLSRSWAEFFHRYDLLVAPAMQIPAFSIDSEPPTQIEGRPCDPLFEDWCSMIYVANLTGQPSLTVPIGLSSDGMPLGMQIIGRRFEDAQVLRAGAAWERRHPWQQTWPPLAAASALTPRDHRQAS